MFAEIVEASFTSIHTIAWRQFFARQFKKELAKLLLCQCSLEFICVLH